MRRTLWRLSSRRMKIFLSSLRVDQVVGMWTKKVMKNTLQNTWGRNKMMRISMKNLMLITRLTPRARWTNFEKSQNFEHIFEDRKCPPGADVLDFHSHPEPSLSFQFLQRLQSKPLWLALVGQKRLSKDVDDITTKLSRVLFSAKFKQFWSSRPHTKMLKIHETGCCILYQLASSSFWEKKSNSELFEILLIGKLSSDDFANVSLKRLKFADSHRFSIFLKRRNEKEIWIQKGFVWIV